MGYHFRKNRTWADAGSIRFASFRWSALDFRWRYPGRQFLGIAKLLTLAMWEEFLQHHCLAYAEAYEEHATRRHARNAKTHQID